MNTLKAEKRSMDVKAKKLRREGFVTGNLLQILLFLISLHVWL